jgi:diguanylate cyclase (GGDEF)-like protein
MEEKRELRQLIEALSGEKNDVNDLYEKALYLATVDDLTGLYNRRYFMMQFQEEIQRGVRFGTPFGLLFLDLDDFKSINDLYGHPLGDQVLRELSILLQKELRSVDVISRYGGEEFAVILPECDVSTARLAASRLRKTVEAQKFTPKQLSLTVSIGVAAFPKHGNQAELLLDNVDKALYQAKKQGKNVVCESDWAEAGLTEKENAEPSEEYTPFMPGSFSTMLLKASTRRKLVPVAPGYPVGSSLPKCFWLGREGTDILLVLEFLHQTRLPGGITLFKVLTQKGDKQLIQIISDDSWYCIA